MINLVSRHPSKVSRSRYLVSRLRTLVILLLLLLGLVLKTAHSFQLFLWRRGRTATTRTARRVQQMRLLRRHSSYDCYVIRTFTIIISYITTGISFLNCPWLSLGPCRISSTSEHRKWCFRRFRRTNGNERWVLSHLRRRRKRRRTTTIWTRTRRRRRRTRRGKEKGLWE